jgi:hypothetical protein
MVPMARVAAILLAALLSFSLISPAVLAADAYSNLPACCRRGGTHQCAMTANESGSSSGSSAQAARCLAYPAAKGVPASATISLPAISRAVFAGLVNHPASRPQTDALWRISYSRASQKRGPPAPLS